MQHREWVLAAVREHEGALLAYATRFAGTTDRARDAVQETFLRLCKQERERLADRLAPWLFAVCRNLLRDEQRKEHRMSLAPAADLDARPDPVRGPSEAAELAETNTRVQRQLARLSDSEQEVIRLRFQNGFSYKEIAEVTGHSVGNVGFLLHNGLKRLRELVVGPSLSGPLSAARPLA
ncbi:MAG TPA: sigma-70 family RNA polymerase sigma factor [Planctomycetia bacterium]|nr:sigma-70 family RNA polymerase sigma factor [Planctomycetia bacterium]